MALSPRSRALLTPAISHACVTDRNSSNKQPNSRKMTADSSSLFHLGAVCRRIQLAGHAYDDGSCPSMFPAQAVPPSTAHAHSSSWPRRRHDGNQDRVTAATGVHHQLPALGLCWYLAHAPTHPILGCSQYSVALGLTHPSHAYAGQTWLV